MYRQIPVDPNQRDLQRIMWKTSADAPVKTYKLATVTYGTVSAPFLATRTLRALADEEKAEFPDAADRGGFELHKWVSNSPELLKDLSASSSVFDKEFQDAPVKTLGMLWDPKVDCLTYKVKISDKINFSKRDVLSEIARLYDPLGLIGPIVTKAKIFIQELWKIKLDWSEQLPPDAMEEWMNFYQKLAKVNNLKIPRCILLPATIRIEIHGFSDASERAYAAVVYIKCFNESGQSQTRLLCSKSRVAPLKTLTIPRFINNIKDKESCNKEKYLTADEVKRSTEFLAKIAQLTEKQVAVRENNVAVGCLVLLKENDLPPCKWTMARILEVIYGTDGKEGGGAIGNVPCHFETLSTTLNLAPHSPNFYANARTLSLNRFNEHHLLYTADLQGHRSSSLHSPEPRDHEQFRFRKQTEK
ncbi:integrase catalytic domain-containing protein [Trichonephila clavipes]|nr:integrase catalytic domain-containing protein [Trichonephila clavipes]